MTAIEVVLPKPNKEQHKAMESLSGYDPFAKVYIPMLREVREQLRDEIESGNLVICGASKAFSVILAQAEEYGIERF